MNINTPNGLNIVVSVPQPSISIAPDKQEFVEIEKKHLKRYVKLADYVNKPIISVASFFWFLCSYGLGNITTMIIGKEKFEGWNQVLFIIWIVMIAVGFTAGILLSFHNKNELFILVKDSNLTYKTKIKEDKE